jgi:hypothetical protein
MNYETINPFENLTGILHQPIEKATQQKKRGHMSLLE